MKFPAEATAFLEPAGEIQDQPAEPGPVSRPARIVANLYKTQAAKVRSYLGFRLGNREDGADAAQDVFVKLLRRESRGQLREEARNYLFSATQSAITDTERWRAVRGYGRGDEIDPDTVAGSRATPDDEFFWREAVDHFVHSVDALPRAMADPFILAYFEGMTYVEISRSLGISKRTAERQVMRAMIELRKNMKEYL